MRTLPLTVQRPCPAHSLVGAGPLLFHHSARSPAPRKLQAKKRVLPQLILTLCAEGLRGQVWLRLLILGVVCRTTWAYGYPEVDDLRELMLCLEDLTNITQRSDAMLYAPSVDEIKKNCYELSVMCYMMELEMLLIEEQTKNDCIFSHSPNWKDISVSKAGSCPPCETSALRNSTIFLDNLTHLLQKLISLYGA